MHQTRNPLGRCNALRLRRSVSAEDIPTETALTVPSERAIGRLLDPSLSSSVQCLCIRLHPHQLSPELGENTAQPVDEYQFDWWKSASRLRPVLEKIILHENFTSEFDDSKDEDEKIWKKFIHSRRYRRREAICLALDRLYYNEQTILFSSIATDLQIEFNLFSSGF
jgi:hypothetical protein